MADTILLHVPKELKNILYGIAGILLLYGIYYLLRKLSRLYRNKLLSGVAKRNGIIRESISYAPFLQLSAFKTGDARSILSNYWFRKNDTVIGFADVSAFKLHKRDREDYGSRSHRDHYSRTVLFTTLATALPHIGCGDYMKEFKQRKADPETDGSLHFLKCAEDTHTTIERDGELSEIMETVLKLLNINYYPYSLGFEVKDRYLIVYSISGRIPAKSMEKVIYLILEIKKLLEKASSRFTQS